MFSFLKSLFATGIFLCGSFTMLQADSCPDPIQIQAVTILNTTCGNATGALIIEIAGGNNGYTFSWQPAVSSTNSAFNLAAGAYSVSIMRNSNPECTLDTTLIVSNSNGPAIQLLGVEPANCLLSNGSVNLGPSNLSYQWSNGESGAINTDLASGCYLITATNTTTGCANVTRVCVPNASPLETYVLVQNGALCGQPTGQAEVLVTGGSGQYSYSLGSGSQYFNLQAGDYECFVVDNVSGCLDSITFNVPAIQASATVFVLPHDIVCHGGPPGFVEFSVVPGLYFQTPYTFSITNSAGNSFAPDDLSEGTYFLQITDANNCLLPADTFSINEPDPLQVSAVVSPDGCSGEGQIVLQIQGGNGGYRVDWADIAGQNDGINRLNLGPGFYEALVYDTLFCTDTLQQVAVPDACTERKYVHLTVPVNASRQYCLPPPAGVGVSGVGAALLPEDASGGSAYGAWTLNNLDCLGYTAGNIPGFAVDTVCVVQTMPALNLKDTVCVVVSIAAVAPSTDTVYFTLQAGTQATACGNIPAGWQNPVVVQADQPGLTGNSGSYGSYLINAFSNCITFNAGSVAGFNVDTICVLIFDTVQNKGHITCFVPSVLPYADCSAGIFAMDSLELFLTDCPATAVWCAPIEYPDILNYYIFDNGLPYSSGSAGCQFDTVAAYPVSLIPPVGPYQMNEWNVDGAAFSGAFSNAGGLLALMQQIDPSGNWALINGQLIAGGNDASVYGSIKITSAAGAVAVLQPSPYPLPRGSELRFSPGAHEVVFRRIQTGCADTLKVQVVCIDCPAVYSYTPDIFGNIRWNVSSCDADTVFCTTIPFQNIGAYTLRDNGVPISTFESCGGFAGMRLDTGFHNIQVTETATACSYDIRFYLACPSVVFTDTLTVVLPLGGSQTLCPDLSMLALPLVSNTNQCAPGAGRVSYDTDASTGCVTLYGDVKGDDLLCMLYCGGGGNCAAYFIRITVVDAADDTLIAVPDVVQILPGADTSIPVLANDIIDGITGYTAGVGTVFVINGPGKGSASYLPASGSILYTPDPGACGTDVFQYVLIDTRGRRDTAEVSIQIACDKILVYNGFSPNGDGKNDVWHILGVEQYPDCEVWVYNRWGGLVYRQQGYRNQDGWDGKWNGKDLPDGAYYYVIDLGDGSDKLSGYLQLQR